MGSMGKMRYLDQTLRTAAFSIPFFAILAIPACQGLHYPDAAHFPLSITSGRLVQEGEVALRDGVEVQVPYKTPFESAPRLTFIVSQAWCKERPFHESDFDIVKQEANFFKIRNNHSESNTNCWAAVKWRAEGIRAGQKPDSAKTGQELIIARVERAGGTLTRDLRLPDGPITAIELQGTRASDADLEQLKGLTSLRSLNLYGTRVTDEGLMHLAGLTGLQTLHLTSTAVTDAGREHLRGLTNLKELGLYQTHVTDAGLLYLKGMINLQDLSLSGPQITDRGLANLKSLHGLHHLLLVHTRVTAAAVAELQRASPRLRVAY